MIEVYKITRKFPKEEVFGLCSQIKRVAVSTPSDIAEGKYRNSNKEFVQFLYVAYGSGAELETQTHIAKRLGFIGDLDYNKVELLLTEIMKMLNVMISKLKAKS